ncbi:tripartite tricarboxylate transporter TctB family protein [Caldimonas brevitalea]|uniref:Putative tricarboxylic transport membrane protein n=1 Tax=Caldimonas brevitalea TaxID=413882 RepID=A0A0G3BPY7_9BURK|nr:tripartite tricarboxylate transporter TctB family protein [Caldimonas brevitalea]AKJ28625.1 putative tricarboxylic transport membrane protein [Caldimonas brevitalea]
MKHLSQQLVGLGAIGLGGLIAVGSFALNDEAGYAGVGAAFMPRVVAAALVLCGLWLVYEAASGGFRQIENHDETARPDWRSLAWLSGGLLLNAALISRAGFVVSCALLFVLASRGLRQAMGQATGAGQLLRDAAVGAAISLPTYWLFTKGLGLALPGLTTSGWI